MAEASQCECMDGPNHVDPDCLYCGGTGIYASDERLAELVRHYTYFVEHSDTISRRQFKTSDQQHVAIFKALQIARSDELRRTEAQNRWREPEAITARLAEYSAAALIRGFLVCPEIADCAPEDLDQETRTLEKRARRYLEGLTKG